MKTSRSKKLSPPRWRLSFDLLAMLLLLGLGAGCGKKDQVRQPETTPTAGQAAGDENRGEYEEARLVAYEFVLVPMPLPAPTGMTVAMEGAAGSDTARETAPEWGRAPGTDVTSMDVLAATGLVQRPAVPADAQGGMVARARVDEQARRGAALFVERVTLTRGTPVLDQAERISGTREIELTDEAQRGMDANRMASTRARVRLCMAENGVPVSADIVESSGFPSLDEKLREAMMSWRYHPQRVDGTLVPFCEQVSFRYQMEPAGDTRPVV